MAKVFIGLLVAVVLVLLYRGMLREQAAVDPAAPLDVKKILAVLRAKHLPCDGVDSFTPIGKSKDGDLDGYLARRWNCTGHIGAMLDPIADKLLVTAMLLYLLHRYGLPLLPVSLILLREIYISGLREYLSGRGILLPVSSGGKWKTALQMIAISTLIGSVAYNLDIIWTIGVAALWIAAGLAIFSAAQYTRASLQHIEL